MSQTGMGYLVVISTKVKKLNSRKGENPTNQGSEGKHIQGPSKIRRKNMGPVSPHDKQKEDGAKTLRQGCMG